MDFASLNLNSEKRQKLWAEQEEQIRAYLEQIKAEVFDGAAAVEENYVSRFSGLPRPNLALRPTTDLAGFLAVSVSPRDPDQLRVMISNGQTAARYDESPDRLERMLTRGLKRWLGQPLYRKGSAAT